MKLVILAVLAILVLGGGAAGAYFYFGQPAQASVGETPEHQKAEDSKHETTDSHGGGKYGNFVELSPLILPVLDDGGISQVVSIVVVIEVEGDDNEKTVEALEPRLKDAYIQELYGVLNRHAAMEGGVLQVAVIKERLARISNKVLGEGVVKDVLLQLVQQRPV